MTDVYIIAAGRDGLSTMCIGGQGIAVVFREAV